VHSLAGAAKTTISASITAIELFGPEIGPYAAVECVISFLMTGHRSVYPSQVLSLAKSSSLTVAKGSEMRDIGAVDYRLRPKSVSKNAIQITNLATWALTLELAGISLKISLLFSFIFSDKSIILIIVKFYCY
jgi:hypothetical protein